MWGGGVDRLACACTSHCPVRSAEGTALIHLDSEGELNTSLKPLPTSVTWLDTTPHPGRIRSSQSRPPPPRPVAFGHFPMAPTLGLQRHQLLGPHGLSYQHSEWNGGPLRCIHKGINCDNILGRPFGEGSGPWAGMNALTPRPIGQEGWPGLGI